MRELLRTMKARLMAGEDLVMATVTASSGAVPRGAGARMLVGCEGRIYGTIGGGAVEHKAVLIAFDVLKNKSSCKQSFNLNQDDVQKLGMICGGACSVFFHYIPGNDAHAIALAEEAERYFAECKDLWMISDIAADGKLSLADKTCEDMTELLTRKPNRVMKDGKDLFIEKISSAGYVYVFGGGHVAQELVPVLSKVGFRCIVMDDREEFTQAELFQTAEKIILGDFYHVLDYCPIGEEDYVCIMTRGHAYDTVLQAQVLKCRPCYCGVIGSRSKAAGVRKVLKEEYGLSDEELDLVTTPIGLSIKSETPAEIAISIAAQMILHRAERKEK